MTPSVGGRRIIVYTAVFGDRDSVKNSPTASMNCEYICYTNWEATVNTWSIQTVEQILDSPRRTARMYKLLPHRFLPPHDISIWVDANIPPAVEPEILISNQLKTHDIASFHHPARQCAYHEGAIYAKNQTDPLGTIEEQLERYRADGFPKNNGLAATGVLIRRNTEQVRTFNELWWHEVANFSVRDQISFSYALWKTKLDWGIIPGRVQDSSLFAYRPHEN